MVLTGMKQVSNTLRKRKKNLKTESKSAVNRISNKGYQLTQESAPRMTGALKKAITVVEFKEPEAWVIQNQPDQSQMPGYDEKVWKENNWALGQPYHIWMYEHRLNRIYSGDPSYWENMIRTLEENVQQELMTISTNSKK